MSCLFQVPKTASLLIYICISDLRDYSHRDLIDAAKFSPITFAAAPIVYCKLLRKFRSDLAQFSEIKRQMIGPCRRVRGKLIVFSHQPFIGFTVRP